MDLIGHFLKATSQFRGRGRLTRWWLRRPRRHDTRRRSLPGGACVQCEMRVPYEAMVWLEHEEQEDLLTLQRLLGAGQTFVDCGANIGLWSLVAASRVGPAGNVFAFEANPATHARLVEHVHRNGLESIVRTIHTCVGAETGSASFLCEAEHNVSHVAEAGSAGAVLVPAATLDAVIGEAPVHGLKIDVEGQEMNVLEGAKDLLRRARPWICVEFNTTLTPSMTLGDWDVHRSLSAAGYRARLFVEAPGGPVLSDAWKCEAYCNLFYRAE